MSVYAFFVGDPRMYDVTRPGEIDDLHDARKVASGPNPWVAARFGSGVALVNLALAYRLEQTDPLAARQQPDPF